MYNDSTSTGNNSLTTTFINCNNDGSLTGTNCGSICAGGDNYGGGGGGCFGNFVYYSILKITFTCCKNWGSLTGTNCGGICAGGDNIGGGGGCFGNYIYVESTVNTSLTATFKDCKNWGLLTGTNCGGICAGGDNYGGGGGCFGNYIYINSSSTGSNSLTATFINCKNSGSLTGTNCGGICAGGDNNGAGGGCFGNFMYIDSTSTGSNSLTATFINCKNDGSLTGTNCGGICAGGDNIGAGGGCFGNYMYIDITSTGSNSLTSTFIDCKNSGSLSGTNCGGICAGGDNNNSAGGGCFGNSGYNYFTLTATFTDCKNWGSLSGTNCGGICAGGDNYDYNIDNTGGGGCFGNFLKLGNGSSATTTNFNVKILTCVNYSTIKGTNCGGICAGGYNYNNANQLDHFSGCFGNALYMKDTFVTGQFNATIENCSNVGKIKGSYGGGICSASIAQPYPQADQNIALGFSINITVNSCNNLTKNIGKYKKINNNTYISSSSGGILTGYVNGSQPTNNLNGYGCCQITINVTNCYIIGYLANKCSGIVGTGDQSNCTRLNISKCYVAQYKNAKNPYVITDRKLRSNVSNCYYGHQLKKITGHLDNLSHQYWKRQENALPILKNVFVN